MLLFIFPFEYLKSLTVSHVSSISAISVADRSFERVGFRLRLFSISVHQERRLALALALSARSFPLTVMTDSHGRALPPTSSSRTSPTVISSPSSAVPGGDELQPSGEGRKMSGGRSIPLISLLTIPKLHLTLQKICCRLQPRKIATLARTLLRTETL